MSRASSAGGIALSSPTSSIDIAERARGRICKAGRPSDFSKDFELRLGATEMDRLPDAGRPIDLDFRHRDFSVPSGGGSLASTETPRAASHGFDQVRVLQADLDALILRLVAKTDAAVM